MLEPHGGKWVPSTDVSLATHSLSASLAAQTMDREARVLRYKEKRKNRKFDKTIRCAHPSSSLHPHAPPTC